MLEIRLKYWRKRRALTITELSKMADVSTQTIVEIEKNRSREVRPATLRKLAKALDVSLEELIVDATPIKVA